MNSISVTETPESFLSKVVEQYLEYYNLAGFDRLKYEFTFSIRPQEIQDYLRMNGNNFADTINETVYYLNEITNSNQLSKPLQISYCPIMTENGVMFFRMVNFDCGYQLSLEQFTIIDLYDDINGKHDNEHQPKYLDQLLTQEETLTILQKYTEYKSVNRVQLSDDKSFNLKSTK